jgi:hypothetical protein
MQHVGVESRAVNCLDMGQIGGAVIHAASFK